MSGAAEPVPMRGRGRARRRGQALRAGWANLSLRGKLLLFALGLVTVPGAVFALVAFSGARAALEREVGIQLQQTAQRGADAVAAALDRARSDARAWARQDLMRDLLVEDLDKRVSMFLATVRSNEPAYLDVLCVDPGGVAVAAGRGDWIGRDLGAWPALRALADGGEALLGPLALADLDGEVIAVGVPIPNPDSPGGRIGTLILLCDWQVIERGLEAIRARLGQLGKQVAAIVVDRDGRLLGGVDFDGGAARQSALAGEPWGIVAPGEFGARTVAGPGATPVEVLVGAAPVPASAGWSVLCVERAAEALAPVRQMRGRWSAALAGILAIGLAVAALLARQVVRPLEEVTRVTGSIAAHPERELPPLAVRSRNEVGQLTDSFNRMTRALKQSRDETAAAAKFAFAGELAAMVAHEVRTPLSVMRSSAQMLARPAAAGAAANAELVETIVAEVDRVERVVTGLIQLARPLEPHPEPTDLGDLLARAAEFVAAHAEAQGIALRRELAPIPPAVCDAEQIYQVVLNLLVNALQALPRGGTVRLRTLPPAAETVGFAVEDDGPGLPAAIRDALFRPFVSGREGGTGLGLTYVERVVTAHRGRIAVHSPPGRGTTFEVRLPAAGATA